MTFWGDKRRGKRATRTWFKMSCALKTMFSHAHKISISTLATGKDKFVSYMNATKRRCSEWHITIYGAIRAKRPPQVTKATWEQYFYGAWLSLAVSFSLSQESLPYYLSLVIAVLALHEANRKILKKCQPLSKARGKKQNNRPNGHNDKSPLSNRYIEMNLVKWDEMRIHRQNINRGKLVSQNKPRMIWKRKRNKNHLTIFFLKTHRKWEEKQPST